MGKPAQSAEIIGVGHYAPSKSVTSAEIEARLGLEPGWIERRTGIVARRYAAPDEALTDIAVKAGAMALNGAGIDRSSVALTLLATSTPDHPLPPSAPLLAHRLGLTGSGGIDMGGACGGFLYALVLADTFVRVHGAPVLVVGANILSRRTNPAERASCVLFADAAGAVVLAPSERTGTGVLGAKLSTDGGGYDLIKIAAGGSRRPFGPDVGIEETLMSIPDGQAVYTRAVDMMAEASQAALEDAGVPLKKIDLFIPHQANARMMDAVVRKIGVPNSKLVSTVKHFGNSSAATIPFTLSSAAREALRPGAKILMCAAGAGLTGGAVVLGL